MFRWPLLNGCIILWLGVACFSPLPSQTHPNTQNTLTRPSILGDDLGLTRKWMVWANELRCLKVQCKNIAFGIPMSFFFWGFFSFVVFFFVIFHLFFSQFVRLVFYVCARVLRLLFFVALIEVKRYLFSGLTQEKIEEKSSHSCDIVDTYNLHCGLSHDRHFE